MFQRLFRLTKRFTVGTIGVCFVLAGIPLTPMPIPLGLPFIAIGFLIMSVEFPFARKQMRKVEPRLGWIGTRLLELRHWLGGKDDDEAPIDWTDPKHGGKKPEETAVGTCANNDRGGKQPSHPGDDAATMTQETEDDQPDDLEAGPPGTSRRSKSQQGLPNHHQNGVARADRR